MKVKPLADRVLVKPLEAEEKTASGLYLPDKPRQILLAVKFLFGIKIEFNPVTGLENCRLTDFLLLPYLLKTKPSLLFGKADLLPNLHRAIMMSYTI